ncbi:hypothetical protein [Sinorhizobium sp. RAC02]|uniref:hypothetical protein n=1 Tax=Sinorhizobium sp. RAC02 TaxID=1842534 RepID=UPI00083D5BAA|nr:hypothetical protein [Sinorhizobium sp. RAC02]
MIGHISGIDGAPLNWITQFDLRSVASASALTQSSTLAVTSMDMVILILKGPDNGAGFPRTILRQVLRDANYQSENLAEAPAQRTKKRAI